MSIWLFFVQFLTARAVPLAIRHGGTLDKGLLQTLGQKAVAVTTVPPALLYSLAFRETNMLEQINRAKQTLQEAEWRLGNITASMANATVKLTSINASLAIDTTLMNSTRSTMENMKVNLSRDVLEGKYNATMARLDTMNKSAQNISVTFGAAKGAKPDTKDIDAKFEALNMTVLLNGTAVNRVLTNFSRLETAISFNVTEYVKWMVGRETEAVFQHVGNRFGELVENGTKSLKDRPCDLIPNETLCMNQTNASTAAAAKTTAFLQVASEHSKVAVETKRRSRINPEKGTAPALRQVALMLVALSAAMPM